MSALNNSLLLGQEGGGGYSISRSVRLNSADSAFFSRTPASAGNRKTWTWAGWVKRSSPGSRQTLLGTTPISSQWMSVLISTDDKLYVVYDSSSLGDNSQETVAVFRDPSAWMHVCVAFDATQGTATNRVKFWVNGTQQTTTNTYGTFANQDYPINAVGEHRIGSFADTGTSYYSNGYLADIHFIDGQALDPTSFGEFDDNGIWQPIAYSGSYGTNGFHLDFSDNSAATATTLGKDSSGNGNNWTPNNLSVTAGAGNDSLVDVPTNGSEVDTGSGGQVRGNYCTLNPLDKTPSYGTLSNGNLDWVYTGQVVYAGSRSTIGVSTGKWYFECTANGTPSAGFTYIGVATKGFNFDDSTNILITGNSTRYYRSDGNKSTSNGSQTTASYGASYTTGDVIGVALDMDAGSITFYKNGSSQGTAYSDLSGTYFACGSSINNSGGLIWNFGQRPFAYTAPSGFKALNTANLPAPVVTKPSTVMDVKLYTGNGSTQTISGLGFSPDLVWAKSRSNALYGGLCDIVRGANKVIYSALTDAEYTYTDALTSFNSDGFSLGADASQSFNKSAATYVAWCWDAGSATVTNTQGSITSSVRTNNYLSVVTYTGTGANATVGHGLGVAPSFYIVKARTTTAANSWRVYHASLGATKQLFLESTSAESTNSSAWNNTAPTSTVFSVGSLANESSGNYVAYCFAPVAGYSSFGSYTGNGSADGPFVFCNFRPRWLLIKRTDAAGENWWVKDAARSEYNAMAETLFPSSSNAEISNQTARYFDFLSNGFKLRGTDTGSNASGGTYIYAAFAESPFQYARAR